MVRQVYARETLEDHVRDLGDVPTPWGRIHVYADKNGHKVSEIRD